VVDTGSYFVHKSFYGYRARAHSNELLNPTMEGEYDIFGNLVCPEAESNASPPGMSLEASRKAIVEAMSFRVGDAVEVKEGGKVYRSATVVKCELDIGSLDLQYADGEEECGVPINLVRKPKASPPGRLKAQPFAGSESQQLQPPEMALDTEPEAQVDLAAPVNPTKGHRSKRESANAFASTSTKEVSKARQCYELVKSFTDEEQEAALQMLLALDRVRKGI